MLTFLEFVCEHLIGPPAHGSMWSCPFHDDSNPSFSVRPPKRSASGSWLPIKFRCFSCGAWGDERDLLYEFYPKETNQQRAKRLQALQKQYEKLTGKPAAQHTTLFIPGERGHDKDTLRFCLAELRSVLREKQRKWRREEIGLRTLIWASGIAHENGVALDDLVRLCASELIAERSERSGATKC